MSGHPVHPVHRINRTSEYYANRVRIQEDSANNRIMPSPATIPSWRRSRQRQTKSSISSSSNFAALPEPGGGSGSHPACSERATHAAIRAWTSCGRPSTFCRASNSIAPSACRWCSAIKSPATIRNSRSLKSTMRFIDPHIHCISRTTDDYLYMARAGVVAVSEPAFWAGFDRSSASASPTTSGT